MGRFLRDALPDGGRLPEQNWRRRHNAIVILSWSQVAGVFVFAIFRGVGPSHALLEAFFVAIPSFLAAWTKLNRKIRACAGTFALLTASGVLTHLSGGSIEMHFHFFVMLAVISLYQDWTPFLLAIGFVLAHHGLVGALDPQSVFNHAAGQEHPWRWAGIHAIFVSGACLVSVITWKFNETSHAEAQESYRLLYEGERAIVHQLTETQRAKEELLSIVSHEFRTPVTSIFGFAKLLHIRGQSLTPQERQEFGERIMSQAERLKVMVENLLSASRPINPELDSETNVSSVIDSVLEQLSEQAPKKGMWFDVEVPPELGVGIGAEPLHLILMNLVSNAVKYGDAGTAVQVQARNGQTLGTDRLKAAVQLSVANHGEPISVEDRARVFEPFVQLDSSLTRPAGGVGLGLHIVRRVVDACSGEVGVDNDNGRIVFTVKLPAGEDRLTN